jgi:RND family efflux transporter MFP subunit
VQQEKQVDAAKAVVRAREQAIRSAQASVQTLKDLQAYLKITAPFDGVVTERMVHPGALVGSNSTSPLLTIQQLSHLRLVVAVPEDDVGGIAKGASVVFRVPAYPERTYSGTVARIARVLDPKTRTMPVELDVINRDGTLSPGMYPTVKWPVRTGRRVLMVPKTSVVTTTERTFVVRDKQGRAEWVDVRKGDTEGDMIEIRGPVAAGDRVLRRGTDEVREGDKL